MIRTTFRRGMALGLLAGAVLTAIRAVQGRRPAGTPAPTWDPIPGAAPVIVPSPEVDVHVAPGPDPEPKRPAKKPKPAAVNVLQEGPGPVPTAAKTAARTSAKRAATAPESEAVAPWVEPTMGECPGTHPVKGKLTSKIFHVPGGFNYPRTKPDRCYLDAAAAEADGLRASKR